jgi:uncharacterized protein YegL
MAGLANDTIGGVNTFLKQQRKLRGGCRITLHQFDHEFETVYEDKSIVDAPNLTDKTFIPRGNTALDDAIVKAVGLTEVRRLAAKKRAHKVVFVIITDGLENASKEASPAQVKALLKAKEKEKWEIVYLGANQDARDVAQTRGVKMSNSMSYAASGQGVNSSYASLSKNVGNLRAAVVCSMAFDEDDVKAQAKLGIKQ